MSRPPSFQFFPRDWLSSTAVRLMSPEARGGYVQLLCHAWLQDEPGILDDDDTSLAALSELGARWEACSVAIRRAFRSTSREGRRVLVQERMYAERNQQAAYYSASRKGGLATQAQLTPQQRSMNAKRAANARWMRSACEVHADIASASAFALEPTHSPSGLVGMQSSPRRNGKPKHIESAAFVRFYETQYPRRLSRDDAAKAWRQVVRYPEDEALVEANTALWVKRWAAEDRDLKHLPYPATYLRAGTWREPPPEE